jgi:hypothetical protein
MLWSSRVTPKRVRPLLALGLSCCAA